MRTSAGFFVGALLLLGCGGSADDDGDGEGGDDSGGDVTPYVYADTLERTDDLASVRFAHAATLLDDGRVLVAGGLRGAPSQLGLDALVAEVELFDPISETFEQGVALGSPRSWPSVTRVDDGRVVIAGGTTLDANSFSTLALAIEVWDPANESVSTIGQLPSGVQSHCAAPISGDVLVIHACGPSQCTILRINPDTGATALAGLSSYDYAVAVACAPLPDGRVLLAGGQAMVDGEATAVAYAEVYDPVQESFEQVGPMSATYGWGTKLAVLADGGILIFGHGQDNGALGQLFSPSSGTFAPIGGGVGDRVDHSLTALADGRVLVVGGSIVDPVNIELAEGIDLLDPGDPASAWTSLSPSFEPRWGHAAVRLASGPVLIIGGKGASGNLADAYMYR